MTNFLKQVSNKLVYQSCSIAFPESLPSPSPSASYKIIKSIFISLLFPLFAL